MNIQELTYLLNNPTYPSRVGGGHGSDVYVFDGERHLKVVGVKVMENTQDYAGYPKTHVYIITEVEGES